LVFEPQYDVRKTWLWNQQPSPGALSIPGGKLLQQTNNNIIFIQRLIFSHPLVLQTQSFRLRNVFTYYRMTPEL